MGGTISYEPKPPGERRFVGKWTRDTKRLGAHEGDLIEFYRNKDCSHWGLYLGNDQVVHFNPKNNNAFRNYSCDGEIDIFADEAKAAMQLNDNVFVQGKVQVDNLHFLARVPGSTDKLDKVRINNKPALRENPRRIEEIRCIVTKLMNTQNDGPLLFYCRNLLNCEHFATYLKFNRSFSELRCGIYETKEVKRLYREVFLCEANGKPITVYDSQCYWIVHFMQRTKQQWDEYLTAATEKRQAKLLIEELHMEIEDYMKALDNTELY